MDTTSRFEHLGSIYRVTKLRNFNVQEKILETVYRSLIESILAFNIIAWYGNLTVKDRARLSRVINLAGKVIGIKQNSLSDIYYQSVRRKACKITQDPTHPLFESFTMLPSGRRLRVPLAKKNCYKHSFIPTAIQILNSR